MTRHSTKDRIRYAVVGLGHIAQVAVLPAFRTAHNSELFALVSADSKKLRWLGKRYGLEHLYSYEDYGRALANVDAVYLALPNHLHREYTERAAAAGVHVLCEKPMAVTADDCRAMIQAAEQNRVKLMIAYRLHLEAANLHAVEVAQSGTLGELRLFTSEFSQQVADNNVRVEQPVSRGGGPLYDMGVYCINAARYLFRDEPIEVSAVAASRKESRFERVEEMASVVMRFPRERIATFTCSFGAIDVSRYALLGTKGQLQADPAYEYATCAALKITVSKKSKTRKFPKRDQFAAEFKYFSDCILKDKEPEPSGYEGMADVRIIEAIYEAIRMKKAIPLAQALITNRPSPHQEIQRPPHRKPHTIHTQAPSREAA